MIQTQQIERNRLVAIEHTAYNFVDRLPQFPETVDHVVYDPLRPLMANIVMAILPVVR